MDAAQYFAAKAAGSIDIRKVSADMYLCVVKKYDPTTGLEANPEILSFTKGNLNDDIKAANKVLGEAQSRVDGLNEMLKDLDAMDK